MDGVRGYWNGLKLISKNGQVVHCPSVFTEDLPKNVELDGELWMGQGSIHSEILAVMNSKNGDWNQMGYYVFDIPSSRAAYEDRMREMAALKPVLPSHVHIVDNIQ